MIIDTSKLRVSTKAIVSALLAFGAFMQIPAVNQYVIGITNAHPKVSGLVTAIAGVYAFLHNPQVQEALGIKETITVSKETVTLPPAGGAQ